MEKRSIARIFGLAMDSFRDFGQILNVCATNHPKAPLMRIHRRTFLRGAGVAVALPMLDAMHLRIRAAEQSAESPKRRMVCINTPLGVHPPYFFPTQAGRDYELSPYL
jgi:hypothetical protein